MDAVSGEKRIALFNLSDEEKTLSVSTYELEEEIADGTVLTELWGEGEAVIRDGMLTFTVPAHSVRAFC